MNDQDITPIAYCGLDCRLCLGDARTIDRGDGEQRRALRQKRMKVAWEMAPFWGNYISFKKSLGALVDEGCKGCRNGGGPPWCKIRRCCQKKGYESCAQCGELETCDKLKLLERYYKDEHLRNLKNVV